MTSRERITPGGREGAGAIETPRHSRRGFVLGLALVGSAAIGVSGRAIVGGGAASAALATPGAVVSMPPASPSASPVAGAEVTIDNFTFSPSPLTVPVGTTVTWTNRDDVPHTVTSVDKTTFASKGLDTDDTFSYRFTKPGTYAYFCTIHPMMTGQVVVK